MSAVSSLVRAGLCLMVMGVASAAPGQALDELLGQSVQDQAGGALAVMGLTAVPGENTGALFLNSGQPSEQSFDFQQAQIGGGKRLGQGLPLYLEGFLGYNRYDPLTVLQGDQESFRLPLKWTTVAATVGLGYEFDLTEHLVLRPLAHLSLGRVQSDVSVAAQLLADLAGLEVDFLTDGGVTAGGYGGSLTLAYKRRWESDWELEGRLRYSELRFEPVWGDKDLLARARAASSSAWMRAYVPTGWEMFDRPVRLVGEAAGSYFNGDQADVLGTDWLIRTAAGVEIDVSETAVPLVSAFRLMARYSFGDHLRGYGLGLALRF